MAVYTKLIKPKLILDAQLSYSNIPEPSGSEVAWVAATSYNVNDVRYYNHTLYRCLVGVMSATTPDNDPVHWAKGGATNRFAMFDKKVGSLSTNTSTINFKLLPAGAQAIAFLEVNATAIRTIVRATAGGTTVYDKTSSMDRTTIDSIYSWFFTDLYLSTDLVLTDLPGEYMNNEIEVTISGSGTVSCGVCVVGNLLEIGNAEYGASVGILDYSVKSLDAFGNLEVIPRSYSKRMNMSIITEPVFFNRIYRTLAELRSTPCVYIGVDSSGFEPFLLYGYYKDFSLTVGYPSYHLCNLEVEGIT